MTIQEVWLHGDGCECGECKGGQWENRYLRIQGPNPIAISSKMNTIIKDQYGQRYIITPIPDME